MNLHTNLDLTLNPAQKPEKLREKVAEITINPQTAPKYSLFFIYLHRAIKQMETIIPNFKEKWGNSKRDL